MSLAITHFLLGGIISVLLFRYFIKTEENIITYTAIAIIGGFWALIPDMPKTYEMFGHAFEGFMGNIFFFHFILDDLDFMDSIGLPIILIMIFLLVILIISPKLDNENIKL